MFFIIFFTIIFIFFFLSLSYFKFSIFGFFLFNILSTASCRVMFGNHLPWHDHIPFVRNYFFIVIIRDAVNLAPAIIQFKSHTHFIQYKNILLLQRSFSLPERDNKTGVLVKINNFGALLWCAPHFMQDRKSKNYIFIYD